VKELGVEARQEREQKTDWIPKPSTVDPSLFAVNHKCKKYLDTLKSIKDITATLKKMGDEETLADDSFEGVKEIFNG